MREQIKSGLSFYAAQFVIARAGLRGPFHKVKKTCVQMRNIASNSLSILRLAYLIPLNLKHFMHSPFRKLCLCSRIPG